MSGFMGILSYGSGTILNTARGFMFALGCIQALRCHTNTCVRPG